MKFLWNFYHKSILTEQSHRSFKTEQDCLENLLYTNQMDYVLDGEKDVYIELYALEGDQCITIFTTNDYEDVVRRWQKMVYEFDLDYWGNVKKIN